MMYASGAYWGHDTILAIIVGENVRGERTRLIPSFHQEGGLQLLFIRGARDETEHPQKETPPDYSHKCQEAVMKQKGRGKTMCFLLMEILRTIFAPIIHSVTRWDTGITQIRTKENDEIILKGALITEGK